MFSNRNDRWHHRLTLSIIFFEFLDVSLSKQKFLFFLIGGATQRSFQFEGTNYKKNLKK